MQTIYEPARETPVVAEADVVVVGGGPAGFAAALAAARCGAQVVLLERYGYLGGLATGGLVLLWDDMDNGHEVTVGGIAREVLGRLVQLGAAIRTPDQDIYQTDPETFAKWSRWGFINWYARRTGAPAVAYAASVDPEKLKYLAAEMTAECGVTLRLHSWVVGMVPDGAGVKGVVIESKQGRHAILGRVLIDATGDGDLFAAAGASLKLGRLPVTLVHSLGGVDVQRALRFEVENAQEAQGASEQLREILNYNVKYWWLPTVMEGVVWCNCPTFRDLDGLDTQQLTEVEVEGRRKIVRGLAFLQENWPGFEKAFLINTANQVGVRQSRLLDGEYTVTIEDLRQNRRFEDTVGRGRGYFIPYRALLPKGLDGLLVAGRCYSATPEAQAISREIAPCMVMGQAAGVAAALAVQQGVAPRRVDIAALQRELRAQGVIL